MNTTYDVPKASVFCDIVEHLKSEGHEPDKDVQEGKAGRLSYHLLWNDIGKVLPDASSICFTFSQ